MACGGYLEDWDRAVQIAPLAYALFDLGRVYWFQGEWAERWLTDKKGKVL